MKVTHLDIIENFNFEAELQLQKFWNNRPLGLVGQEGGPDR